MTSDMANNSQTEKEPIPNAGRPFTHTNRLAGETSPYLLQHAHNPVDWYPWGEEAFRKAQSLNRPLFVSIGYSTCHWCHVMENESFEDEEIARFLNSHFISVKVDREERPDVDSIYMGAVQLMTGSGGWPLNVILTPWLKPFFGGTYFPARDGDRGAFTGFLTLLRKIADAWENQRDSIERSSEEITAHIQSMLSPAPGSRVPGMDVLERAVDFYKKVYDPAHGGVTGAPKFPATFPVRFLLQHALKNKDSSLETMVTHTLTHMARGGMYDQIGGGFHRYSTDKFWIVPHFEKMLYDNALLIPAYLEGFKATGDPLFEITVRDIITYLMRELLAPEGGFYSASDADSPAPSGKKEEGYYFTWTEDELVHVLGENDAKLARAYFSMDGHPSFEGRHIPHLTVESINKAKGMGINEPLASERISDIKARLYTERKTRIGPSVDTKILSAWNGLMISALARAGAVLNDVHYLEAAGTTARFIWDFLTENGRLKRAYTRGQARLNAYLDDYAFVIAGFLDLYETGHQAYWLEKAIKFAQVTEALYEDKNHGGFFMTASDHEALIAREKPVHDGALPSGNSIMVQNLLRLYDLTNRDPYLNRAALAFQALSKIIENRPETCAHLLMALDFYHNPPIKI